MIKIYKTVFPHHLRLKKYVTKIKFVSDNLNLKKIKPTSRR